MGQKVTHVSRKTKNRYRADYEMGKEKKKERRNGIKNEITRTSLQERDYKNEITRTT